MRRTTRMRGVMLHGVRVVAGAAVLGTSVATLAQVAGQAPSEPQRQVYLVRQDFSDCTRRATSPTSIRPWSAEMSGSRGAQQQHRREGRHDGHAQAPTYHFFLKCVRLLGDITTDDEGAANVSFAFPTNLAGPVFVRHVSGRGSGGKQIPKRAGFLSVTHSPALAFPEGTMSMVPRSLTFVATSFVVLTYATPVHAQATRTWVSGVGDDANPCSRTAPCKTFAGAISKTALDGEINCLDPGGFGAVTITKSITIDCHEVFASILKAGPMASTSPSTISRRPTSEKPSAFATSTSMAQTPALPDLESPVQSPIAGGVVLIKKDP